MNEIKWYKDSLQMHVPMHFGWNEDGNEYGHYMQGIPNKRGIPWDFYPYAILTFYHPGTYEIGNGEQIVFTT